MNRTFLIALTLFALCSCQGRQVQNPSVEKIKEQKEKSKDAERQAKIEKILKNLKYSSYGGSSAVSVLGMLGAIEYANDIAEFLKDKDRSVRYFAVRSLDDLGAKEYAKD